MLFLSAIKSAQRGKGGRERKQNKDSFPNYPSAPPLSLSLCLLSVPLGSGWPCDLKKASHIALAVMASNTVASKSMEPVLDFAAVSTLSL